MLIPFGKFRNTEMISLPKYYLKWLTKSVYVNKYDFVKRNYPEVIAEARKILNPPSKFEILCKKYLDDNNIKFIQEHSYKSFYRYKDCPYRFDFYINNMFLFEIDGNQHFEFTPYFHKSMKSFEEQQKRDRLKNIFCEVNRIPLLRVSYSEGNNIPNIIDNYMKNKNNIITYVGKEYNQNYHNYKIEVN